MQKHLSFIGSFIFGLLGLFAMTVFTVDQRQFAIIFQLGEIETGGTLVDVLDVEPRDHVGNRHHLVVAQLVTLVLIIRTAITTSTATTATATTAACGITIINYFFF